MTKQEQIEEIAVIGCVRNPQAHTAEECSKCDFKQGMCNAYRHAEALYNAGYGDVSEYKAEIERLTAEFKQLETNAEILARGVRDLNHENYELTEKVKQAQIDVLNKAKEKFNAISRVLADDSDIGADIDGIFAVSSCIRKIDELIKEVQNEN